MHIIDLKIITHKLNINPKAKPMQQKNRKLSREQNEVIKTRVDTLKEMQVVREIDYPTWLSKIVLINKVYESPQMCVAFIDLNDTCSKDCFPLPSNDQLVDTTVGFNLMIFLNAYFGYHQIKMHLEYEEKTSFISKNARTNYEHSVNKMFKGQLEKNMEAYINDMVIKFVQLANHVKDLKKCFGLSRAMA